MTDCPKCGGSANESLRHCPSCGCDWGYPNVRRANTSGESNALRSRYDRARADAAKRGIANEFESCDSSVRNSSHVVVAMPLLFARTLLTDARTLYTGYEALIGAPTRVPAAFENDSERHAVGGRIFGSYAREIRYGVLSLNGRGLSNYGVAFVTLRDVVVRDRVTFLHENSYLFSAEHDGDSSWPIGFLSSWANRHELASAKLEPVLERDSSVSNWADLLVHEGTSRAGDRIIEAHIFGSFNADSIESILFAEFETSRADRSDIECIKEILEKRERSRRHE